MYQTKKFDHLLGLAGLSDALLTNHVALYEGYVAQTNKLAETLATKCGKDEMATPEYAELKRRFGWEFNGMRLHEYYFGNLSKEPREIKEHATFVELAVDSFGSFDEWQKDFRATGAMRGIGWVVAAYDPEAKRLFNVWVNEHDVGHLVGTEPLLVMDVFEHAFMLDYGLKRAEYIDVFWKAIDWDTVEARAVNGSVNRSR